jgi:hypothetical protein
MANETSFDVWTFQLTADVPVLMVGHFSFRLTEPVLMVEHLSLRLKEKVLMVGHFSLRLTAPAGTSSVSTALTSATGTWYRPASSVR